MCVSPLSNDCTGVEIKSLFFTFRLSHTNIAVVLLVCFSLARGANTNKGGGLTNWCRKMIHTGGKNRL